MRVSRCGGMGVRLGLFNLVGKIGRNIVREFEKIV